MVIEDLSEGLSLMFSCFEGGLGDETARQLLIFCLGHPKYDELLLSVLLKFPLLGNLGRALVLWPI